MTNLRRWQIEGSIYHIITSTRFHEQVLTGIYAEMVSDEIAKLTSEGNTIISWCIMPDHIHLLIQPVDGKISDQVRKLKSRIWNTARKKLNRTERLWEYRYFDRRLRSNSESEIYSHAEYIENNPVKAGFVEKPEDWKWSSAHSR